MSTKETSADKTKYRLAEAAEKVYGFVRHRCHDSDADRADLRRDEADLLPEFSGQI